MVAGDVVDTLVGGSDVLGLGRTLCSMFITKNIHNSHAGVSFSMYAVCFFTLLIGPADL